MLTNDAGLVGDDPEHQRFKMETSAGLAMAKNRPEGDVLIFYQTEVPRRVSLTMGQKPRPRPEPSPPIDRPPEPIQPPGDPIRG